MNTPSQSYSASPYRAHHILLTAASLIASAAAHAAPLLAPSDPIFAYDLDTAGGNPGGTTFAAVNYPAGEAPGFAIDGSPATKYLNFGENNSGFFVVPGSGRSIIDSFQLTTANDADVRDPATWQIHGMDDTGVWSLLGSGSVTLPVARGAAGPIVSFSNTTICRAYRMTFTTVKNATSANSMQVAEAQFFGNIVPAKDTDNDLMDDDWETLYNLIVGVNDAAGDLDSDSSPNI